MRYIDNGFSEQLFVNDIIIKSIVSSNWSILITYRFIKQTSITYGFISMYMAIR